MLDFEPKPLEVVVVEAGLGVLVLALIAERHESAVAAAVHHLAVDIEEHLPHQLSAAVVGLERRATIFRAHADESKSGEHDCKYHSYHLHGLLLSILQN